MKIFSLVVFFTAIFACEANPFTDAHAYLHGVFLDQKNYLDGVREFVSVYSEIVAYDMMEIVVTEMTGWETRGKTCLENIFRPRNNEEIGEQFSICVFGASTHVFTVQSLILQAVEDAQEETYEMQQALLRELQREDILEISDNFYDHAVEMGRQMTERFYNERYPLVVENLDSMDWTVENVPGLLQNCISAIARKYTIFC